MLQEAFSGLFETSLRGRSLQITLKLWVITVALGWNISILLGVISSRMTMPLSIGSVRGHWIYDYKWCESYAMTFTLHIFQIEHLRNDILDIPLFTISFYHYFSDKYCCNKRKKVRIKSHLSSTAKLFTVCLFFIKMKWHSIETVPHDAISI